MKQRLGTTPLPLIKCHMVSPHVHQDGCLQSHPIQKNCLALEVSGDGAAIHKFAMRVVITLHSQALSADF